MFKRAYISYHTYKKTFWITLCLCYFVFTVLFLSIVAREGEAFIYQQTGYLARLITLRQDQIIKETNSLLTLTNKRHQLLYYSKTDCDQLMKDLLAYSPYYTNFAVLDVSGQVICSAINSPGNINVAYRPYIQQVMQHRQFVVGQFQKGTFTGKPVLPLAIPLMDSRGEVKAVFATFLDLRWIHTINQELTLPNRMFIVFVDSNGFVIDYQPKGEKYQGKKISDSELFQAILANKGEGQGTYWGIGNEKGLFSFSRLINNTSDYQIYAVVGLPYSALVETAFSSFQLSFIISIVSIFLIGFIFLAGRRYKSYLAIKKGISNLQK